MKRSPVFTLTTAHRAFERLNTTMRQFAKFSSPKRPAKKSGQPNWLRGTNLRQTSLRPLILRKSRRRKLKLQTRSTYFIS